MRREIARAAHYMAEFRCLGGSCEDTCCAGWTVPVDEPTHRHLRVLAESDATAQRLLDEGIELTPGGSSFGRLKFAESGRCGMLDGEGLCQVHARLGVDALFDVCTTYPRYFNEVDGELELFGTLSCPEVARRCLLADDALEITKLSEHEAPRKLRNRFATEPPYHRPFFIVREALTRVLALPDHTLSEKLFALLWLSNKLGDVLHARAAAAPLEPLNATLKALLEPEALHGLGDSYRELAVDGSLALTIVSTVLGEAPEAEPSVAWKLYCERRDQISEAARARIDHCVSRYALNHVYTTPYLLHESLFGYVRDLSWRVAALRYVVTRSSGDFGGSAADVDRRLVDIIYRFARRIEHSPLFEELGPMLERQGLSTFAHTIGFLRL